MHTVVVSDGKIEIAKDVNIIIEDTLPTVPSGHIPLIRVYPNKPSTHQVVVTDVDNDVITFVPLEGSKNPDWINIDNNTGLINFEQLPEHLSEDNYRFSYVIYSYGTKFTRHMDVRVTNNEAPIIEAIDQINAGRGVPYYHRITVFDLDEGDNEGVRIEVSALPSIVTYDEETHLFTVFSETITTEPAEFSITATDQHSNVRVSKIIVNVGENCGGKECVDDSSIVRTDFLASLPNKPDVNNTEELNELLEPFTSYNESSEKGNDNGSVKLRNITDYYLSVRHSHNDINKQRYREFTIGDGKIFTTPPVFATNYNADKKSIFNVQDHNLGIYKKEFLENRLDYYNFLRALYGSPKAYISYDKQLASQAGSWVGIRGGDDHAVGEIAETEWGVRPLTRRAGNHSRSASNMQTGSTNGDQSGLNHFNSNKQLTTISMEGDWGNIAALGHRYAFLGSGKDIGFGTYNWSQTQQVYGSHSATIDRSEWTPEELRIEEHEYYKAYPSIKEHEVKMLPAHGYQPLVAFAGTNQTVSLKTNNANITPLSDKEKVVMKMEFFRHREDGDLSQNSTIIGEPIDTFLLSDIQGTNHHSGGESPVGASISNGKDYVSNLTEEQHYLLGRWHFTVDNKQSFRFRMPQKWWNDIATELDQLSKIPEKSEKIYFTVRYTITGDNGGMRIKTPFYMNQTIGNPLVVQTTIYDPTKEPEYVPPITKSTYN
ncbi:hypothetical protein ERW51_12785 [Aliivibrio finisterrensis]|uniref:hypothetical protein n=1 Tax=Aliivibrio finisterrensis TaxID=511998 RepID=UPI0010225DFD|nr:hypothetical protein [Aliivibrio finisterrensis]RYU67030.1 hypothetical protein ERW54_13515 [Aliivibrio finisterrensis]RYU70256.1 hypothetical protein ERW51_12785 [Aliivibrio finisterrensis]RYU72394.1 hypothetical protein ERW48_15480 [Aliivibrio finisterrensis]